MGMNGELGSRVLRNGVRRQGKMVESSDAGWQ